MPDYHEELQRRIEQFTFYLKKMYDRSHEEICGPCFMIFSEDSPNDDDADESELSEEAVPELELSLVTTEGARLNENSLNDDPQFYSNIPDEGWRQDDSQKRFIQFSIEKNWFCVDTVFYRKICGTLTFIRV